MRLIKPYRLNGQLHAVGSKSYLQRALAIASLAGSPSEITNVHWSADSEAALNAAIQLGSTARQAGEVLQINPGIPEVGDLEFHCQESGLSLNIFACIAATMQRKVRIQGTGTLLNRPLKPLMEVLTSNGVHVSSNRGKLPITVRGPLKGGHININGRYSSQAITGMLIALPILKTDSVMEIVDPSSIPYIEMTLDIIGRYGVKIEHEAFRNFHIAGNQSYRGCHYEVEGDWSTAANLLVAAAVSGEISYGGLTPESRQADKAIMEVLQACGAQTQWQDKLLTVRKDRLDPFHFDATHCPDLFPPLVILAAACRGASIIKGTQRLLHKESNRLNSLAGLGKRIGINMTSAGDELIIHGTGSVTGGRVCCYHDHRIAMAAAVAGAIATGNIRIDDPDVVQKSYPAFFDDLETCIKYK